jgi:hypothetical protein
VLQLKRKNAMPKEETEARNSNASMPAEDISNVQWRAPDLQDLHARRMTAVSDALACLEEARIVTRETMKSEISV